MTILSRTVTDLAGNGYHMRTVNGGTPERIRSPKAVQEVNYARELGKIQRAAGGFDLYTRPPVEVILGEDGHSVRIDYHGVQGVVELRPATGAESVAVVKPEAERYEDGQRVIVRGTWYESMSRRTFVLPEYEGTIVGWYGSGYSVRAVEPDEDGVTYGVRKCQVRELRPAVPPMEPRETGPVEYFTPGSREERIHATRLEALDAARNAITAEQARQILARAGHSEWAEGREGFRFRTNRHLVALSAVYANGDMWHERMSTYGELFDRAGWIVEHGRGFHGTYLRLISSYGEVREAIREAMRRLVEAAHGEALAENARRNGDTEGTHPGLAQDPNVVAVLEVLRAAGVPLAMVPRQKLSDRERYSKRGPQGALITRLRVGRLLEVHWGIDGAFDERHPLHRASRVRPVRNTALEEIAQVLRGAGWYVDLVMNRITSTPMVRRLIVSPPAANAAQDHDA
ncbi:hypothetical protein HHL19_35815 [Streptomyces sp. R302]|uniref:hypothetical protein n=1 Tax=unclassified Streptomyces TaxID=2593676 RepID=UPI00145DBE1E|nr:MULTISPECIES: hypothetical protein [unclassified Streptomyces]NML55092.1 hypothetical protein [Streptomyces sp. R301]NML83878.1 hypothetical protein [Streptomyces sp. R302]